MNPAKKEQPEDDGTVRASVQLDRRAWETTRAAAQLLDMELDEYLHDALERQLREYQLPVASFWAEVNTADAEITDLKEIKT